MNPGGKAARIHKKKKEMKEKLKQIESTKKIITCPICGTTGHTKEFEHHPNNTGCWCPDCQTFIWSDPSTNDQHNILLLETPTTYQSPADKNNKQVPYKFKKRLSPLRYPGGKSKLIDYLFTCLHANKLETFVEVFAGGASFGLALLDAGAINHLVLNDADKNLITFWNEVFYNPEPLIQKLSTITPTHEDYAKAKDLLTATTQSQNPLANPVNQSPAPQLFTQSPDPQFCNQSPAPQLSTLNSQFSTSAAERRTALAWAYLLVNRLSYSGIQKAGCLGGRSGSAENLLVRYNPQALIKQISHLASLKDKITILNQDYTDVIQKYYWKDQATLFIDPPYRQKGKALYDLYFTDEDHRTLAELIQSLTLEFPGCADILITYDNDPYIQDLYWTMEKTTINRKYSI